MADDAKPAPIEPSACFALARGVELRPFGAELVLLDGASGEYFALNEVGAELLRCWQQGSSLEQSVSALLPHYDTTKQQLQTDARRLLEQLLKQRLLEQVMNLGEAQ